MIPMYAGLIVLLLLVCLTQQRVSTMAPGRPMATLVEQQRMQASVQIKCMQGYKKFSKGLGWGCVAAV